jgi:peroxiredoxin
MKLAVKDQAPDFNLPDQNGEMHSLKKYHGQYVLLYFYPKDDTPGCTKEACSFRDNFAELKKAGVVILELTLLQLQETFFLSRRILLQQQGISLHSLRISPQQQETSFLSKIILRPQQET